MVEHRTCNAKVAGSIPARGRTIFLVREVVVEKVVRMVEMVVEVIIEVVMVVEMG